MLPPSTPRLSREELHIKLASYKIDRKKYPLIVVGIRGYYLNTLGAKGKNDRNIYDDAIFIDTDNVTAAFNANTDPSVARKGIAVLQPGVYYAHKFATHNGRQSSYPAICQRLGKVKIIRDGETRVQEGSNFGINIHRGGRTTTSSEGCQTIPPDQWTGFYELAKSEARRIYGDQWNKVVIPYILLDQMG